MGIRLIHDNVWDFKIDRTEKVPEDLIEGDNESMDEETTKEKHKLR